MIRKLVTIGDKRLLQKSKPVAEIDDEIKKLIVDMTETMYAEKGIGLAAVQVGVLKRIFVVDIPQITEEALVFINPVLTKKSRDKAMCEEGCLSVPGLRYQVQRPRSVLVEYQDLDGNKRELTASDLLAVCIQHEYDHLEGVLFIENTREKEHKKINDLLAEHRLPKFF